MRIKSRGTEKCSENISNLNSRQLRPPPTTEYRRNPALSFFKKSRAHFLWKFSKSVDKRRANVRCKVRRFFEISQNALCQDQ